MPRSSFMRPLAAVALASLVALALTVPATAHVDIRTEGEITPGGSGTIGFRIPHGCGELATDTVEVRIPEGVVGVQAAWVPGWTVEADMVETQPYERFGETLTERVGVVRWSGGSLPSELFFDFTIRATFPEDADQLLFPTVQRCGDEELAWIQVAEEGQDPDDLEHPTPALRLTGVTTDDGSRKAKGGKAKKDKGDGHDHDHG